MVIATTVTIDITVISEARIVITIEPTIKTAIKPSSSDFCSSEIWSLIDGAKLALTSAPKPSKVSWPIIVPVACLTSSSSLITSGLSLADTPTITELK